MVDGGAQKNVAATAGAVTVAIPELAYAVPAGNTIALKAISVPSVTIGLLALSDKSAVKFIPTVASLYNDLASVNS